MIECMGWKNQLKTIEASSCLIIDKDYIPESYLLETEHLSLR